MSVITLAEETIVVSPRTFKLSAATQLYVLPKRSTWFDSDSFNAAPLIIVSFAFVPIGFAFTVTVAVALNEILQLPLDTSVKFNTTFDVAFATVTSIFPPAGIVTGLAGKPDAPLYVTTSPAVPVNVKTASSPEHTGLFELIVAANGNEFTVTVVLAVNAILQFPFATSVKFNVLFDVTPLTVTSTVPPEPIVAVPLNAPLYVTTSPTVPIIVKTASSPEHIGLLELSVGPNGNPFTITFISVLSLSQLLAFVWLT